VAAVNLTQNPEDEESPFAAEEPVTARLVRAIQKPVDEQSPEERARMDAMDLRCLSLCIGMLERVNGVRCPFF
jgi:condensin complex subunit 3